VEAGSQHAVAKNGATNEFHGRLIDSFAASRREKAAMGGADRSIGEENVSQTQSGGIVVIKRFSVLCIEKINLSRSISVVYYFILTIQQEICLPFYLRQIGLR